MKILGIDYGRKRIGLAVGDSGLKIAAPLKVIENTGDKEAIKSIKSAISQEGIERLVIGLPLSADGQKTAISLSVEVFAERLKQETDLEIDFESEALTSHEIRYRQESDFKMLKNPVDINLKKNDSQAAAVILEKYFCREM